MSGEERADKVVDQQTKDDLDRLKQDVHEMTPVNQNPITASWPNQMTPANQMTEQNK